MFAAKSASHFSTWIIILAPNLVISAACILLMVRSNRSGAPWLRGKPAPMPAELIAREPRRVGDMRPGEAGYVYESGIAVSKRSGKTYVDSSSRLQDPPTRPDSLFNPLPIRRLTNGFSITVFPHHTFRTSSIPIGWYSPVVEILQSDPAASSLSD